MRRLNVSGILSRRSIEISISRKSAHVDNDIEADLFGPFVWKAMSRYIILLVGTAKPRQYDLGVEAKRVRQKGKQKEGRRRRRPSPQRAAREKLSTFGARKSLLDRILAEGLPADPITRGA